MLCPNGHGEGHGKFCGMCGAELVPAVTSFAIDGILYEIRTQAVIQHKNILLEDSLKLLAVTGWVPSIQGQELRCKVLAICNHKIDISALALALNAEIAKKVSD